MKTFFLTMASILLMQSMCSAQEHSSYQNVGITKTISQEIVFVPLSAIQPQTLSKPLSKKALFALLTVGGALGKLLLKNNAGHIIELLKYAYSVLFKEEEKSADDTVIESVQLEELVSLAQLISEQAQQLLEN